MTRRFVLAMTILAACGGGGENTGPDGNHSASECESGGRASSDSYLPFDVGNLWRYEVSDPTGSDPTTIKRQQFKEENTPPGAAEPVMIQETIKANGRTVNWLRRDGDVTVRVRQEDYTPEGLLQRITLYEPYRMRLDESPARLVDGATWDESYTDIIQDPTGVEIARIDVIDRWTVMGVDVPCATPFGELSCIKLHQERVEGGVAIKDFYFARGYGKVREEGGQTEQLIGCSLY